MGVCNGLYSGAALYGIHGKQAPSGVAEKPQVTVDNDVRALDALGAAIYRATSVLGSVGELYSTEEEKFHGGNAFAAHAVSTAYSFLLDAASALADLHAEHISRTEAAIAAETAAAELQVAQPQIATVVEHLTPENSVARVSEDESDVASILLWQGQPDQRRDDRDPTAGLSPRDGVDFAESYDELLRKVTAFEIFAQQEVQSNSPLQHRDLIPLVKNLREGLIKFGKRSA